jgi:hypothetical protein
MKPQTSMAAGVIGACIMLCGVAAHAVPVIANVYPNGTNLFQPTNTLSFTVTSVPGVTNVVVDLTAQDLYTGTILLKHYTSASGLTISGPNVSAPLSSNQLYSASIVAYDASGSATNTESFDTITPAYTWEAEDFDYTNGLFFDTGVNKYANLSGTAGVDYNNSNPGNGSASYRPKGLETENPNSGDSPRRLQYIGTTNLDYNVGWTARGDWGNYTRSYPAGTYTMFVRASGGGGLQTESADITVQSGTAVISSTGSGVAPYKFGVPGNGWGTYNFVPVTDSAGDLIHITFDGSACTLRETQVNNADNMNFFMLMPVPPIQVSTVTITNVYPDGLVQFEYTNTLSFNATSTVAINPPTDVSVQLAGTNLFGAGSVSLLTTANGLSYTGNSTNITVTCALTSNMVYTTLIIVNDANGVPASQTVKFDTITPYYTFEAEDFNYGPGLFIDNPQTNAYGNPNPPLDGTAEIDYHRPSGATIGQYNRFGLDAENCGDVVRVTHGGLQDYDIGFTTSGDWGNYTRTFPVGTNNIFVRVSRGAGGVQTDAGKISLVTSDPTVSGQTTLDLGRHNTPPTGDWQKYAWVPVINSGGYPARFVGDGTPKTLRYTFDGAGENVNFFLLMPADLSVNPPPYVSGFSPDGSSLFQPSNMVTFVANSSVGLAQTNVVLNLNGVNVSGLTFSGSSTEWTVSYPVRTNGAYTAIITLTDTAGTTKYTNVFETFSANDYQWEAEDYNYSNGLYFDATAPVDSYLGLSGVSGVDYFESDPNGPGRSSATPYRPANGSNIPDATAGDQARSQFTAVSGTDYNIGSFGVGSWANYTRHYPAGSYNVAGRFAEGAGFAGADLALVTNGASTNILGTFTIPNEGWGTWQWVTMLDNSGNPAQVTLDGSAQILRLDGTTPNEVNVNFLMLVPTTPKPRLTATVTGGNISISFATQTGYSYQVQYKNNLTDAVWTPLGGAISGNGSVQSASDSGALFSRFYRVQVH